ncbi:hypothetical protein AC579_2786 [Pseudocercospora musae]|uniref:Uncharacterized protein n=1 Tax=Pseudocercospora musae TaxID=113226 RepID=A0A139HZ75_9PEZI|nr:hypothetical protein AC579_2786 [Pseudocercospora musae]KXT07766.1 hypothetical protein AC579_2786 [Pseudocercospora musae]
MRYEELDILIFPGGHDGSGHIPTQEFRVSCVAVHDPNPHPYGPTVVPVMTSFLASLHPGAPFQVSIHSWGKRNFFFDSNARSDDNLQTQVWHAQITVDGVLQSVEVFGPDIQWPKVIANSNMQTMDGAAPLLQFPAFHRSTMSQTGWDALDETGRIKVVVSEGWLRNDGKSFHKLATHVIFNFQPAPLDVLQRCDIAWPNATIMANPVGIHQPSRQSSCGSMLNHDLHHRNASINSAFSAASAGAFSSSPALGGHMPGPPPPTPTYADRFAAYHYPPDGSSRSTSAYTTISQAALPLTALQSIGTAGSLLPFSGMDGERLHRGSEGRLRMPSGRLDDLLGAIREQREAAGAGQLADAFSMPPPPLPQHAVRARTAETAHGRALGSPMMTDSGAQVNEEDLDNADRRAMARSNISDVSMHANCENFPTCTSEDAHGHLVHHSTGVAPAAVMRSRKEGSADLTNRDFLSNLINQQSDASAGSPSSGASIDKASTLPSSSPAIGSNKKRTRSALKQLNVNEASSPEKEPTRKMVTLKLRKRKTVLAGSDD